ncbi:MAG: hypothetical protein QOI34_908 [Verrucomicrobiota bacterium]
MRERLQVFLFPVEGDKWLAILRVGLGLQVLLYALALKWDWNYLLAGKGKGQISRDLAEALLSLESPAVPRLGWFVSLGAHSGVGEETILPLTWILLFFAGSCLVVGFYSRLAAVLGWLLHLSAAKSGGLASYGVDNFMTIGLFYLMTSPLPDRYALDWRFRKTTPEDSRARGFFRRVLQLHLCLIYFFSGLTKALGRGWWDGSNIWRALIRPSFNVLPAEMLIKWKILFPIAGVSIWLLEIGYPFFVWHRKLGRIWLTCICAMHLMIGLTMGMYLFALIMIVLNLAAFGPKLAFISHRTPE